MEVQVASLCDSAADYNGKLCVLGTFDAILSPNFPFSHQQCSIALRLLFRADDEGDHTLRINIVNEDGQPLVTPIEITLNTTIPDDTVFLTRNIVLNLPNLKFERPGFYSVDVTAGERLIAGIPFRVVQFQPPGGQQP